METEVVEHPATPVSEEFFTSTTTMTTGSTVFTTVTVTPTPTTGATSWAEGDGCTPQVESPVFSGAYTSEAPNVAATTSDTMTWLQTIATVAASGGGNVTTVTEAAGSIPSSLSSPSATNSSILSMGTGTTPSVGVGATNGTSKATATSSHATTWNSTQPVPHGPASSSALPPVSAGSKTVKKGNSGNGSSGLSCVLMLVALAMTFTYVR